MNIAIVDDLKTDRQILESFVIDYFTSKHILTRIDTYENGESLINHFKEDYYHIIFLDIYMDQLSGIDAARMLRKKDENCKLVFITTSSDYAVASYEVQASYYLIKPIDSEKLNSVLDICMKNIDAERYFEVLADRLPTRILVKHFLYASTYQNAMYIHTTAGVVKTYMTFREFLTLLGDDPKFLSCYKGCIVNMDQITGILDDCFIMSNMERVPIRKKSANVLKKTYTNYLLSRTRS